MKGKKLLALGLTLSLGFTLLTGCGGNASQDAQAQTQQPAEGASTRQVLRVGMECAYAPFNWSQEGDTLPDGSAAVPIYGTNYYAGGYDVMVAQMLAEKLDMDLEIHKVEWASIGMGLNANDYDCIIAGMGLTPERAEIYDFTQAYYLRDLCLTVKADGAFADITKLSDFAGKGAKATTQLGTAWVEQLVQIPDMQPGANYETTAECFMAVTNGVADVCMVDYPTSKSAAMTNANLKILEFDPSDTLDASTQNEVCIGCRKGDTALRDKLDGVLTELDWNQEKMTTLMDTAITLQPSAA